MTIYFDKRAYEQQDEEEQKAIEEKQKQEAAVKAVGQLVGFFTKPLVLMLLWNWIMPGLFSLATIGYLKALGIYAISRILFGNNHEHS